MKEGAEIFNIDDYRKQFCHSSHSNVAVNFNSANQLAIAANATNTKRNALALKLRNPYALLKLLRTQNWFAKRAFLPRIDIRLSAYTPCGKSAVKIKL